MHTQVMSNNNGTGAQVNDLVAQVISVVEDNKKLKVKLAKSIIEKNEMEEENKKLKEFLVLFHDAMEVVSLG